MSRFAELADGRRLEFPDETTDDVIQAAVQRELGVTAQPTREQRLGRISELEAEQADLEEPDFFSDVIGGTISDLRGVPEAIGEFVTGAAATAAGGAAAIPVTAIEALRGGEDPAGAGKAVIEEFQDRFTFQPRTEVGKRATEAFGAPIEAVEQEAADLGEIVGFPVSPPFKLPGKAGEIQEKLDTLGATAVKTAIVGAPAVFGARKGLTTTKPAGKPTPRQQVAASAAEEGYVTPPSVRGEAGAAGLAEGAGGKLKVAQQAVETNQAVTNNLAARAVGLPEGVPVTVDILQGIRSQAGQAYEAIRGVGQIITDTTFRRDLSGATARFRTAAKDFPELAKSEIIDVVDGLRVAQFDAASGIDAISLLRNKGDVAFRGGDKALGNSYRAAADAIEGVMERHLGRGSDVAAVESFRQARQQIATTYSVQEALQARITGEVSATQLAAQLKKGKPLSGDLRTIADFANTFPTVSKLFIGTAQAFSPLDLAAAALGGTGAATALTLGAGPAALLPLAAGVARPLLRKGALTDAARHAGLPRGSTTPAPNALLGIATSGALREDQ